MATTLGANQPFRYRGYVYDNETGWYYLQSRYYDSIACHFISSDFYLSTGQDVLGHNSYAYCLNNPVNMYDDGGEAARFINIYVVNDGGGSRWRRKILPPGTPICYINNQNDPSIRDWKFGKSGTIGNNGCGLIALYNVRVASGYRKGFEKFYQQYSDTPMLALAGGKLGTNPASITGALYGFFGKKNIFINAKEVDRRFDAIIVLYIWRSGMRVGAHYFAAVRNRWRNYIPYNDSDITSSSSVKNILQQVPGQIIAFWGIYF